MGGELLELAARVEAATADQQRTLLNEVFYALHPEPDTPLECRFQAMLDAEAYESAALMLVPEGALWSVDYKVNIGEYFRTPEGEPERAFRGGVGVGPVPMQWYYSKHFASPALALCAAALRARSQTSE